ncbi:carbohydrate-selective porin, OprB family protein [Collimonas arenae]|uniref:Carbohydrate-selective porin, OprB family protein n=2 Tax=Collimonas arenae TaxID=279058 RepID=A0A127QEK7_9BURK|nr:carbohydrate porin [Collimonas arenae]AMP08461.1 carbohydrate-selective porin, OprB family protein [Collimonas arenae]
MTFPLFSHADEVEEESWGIKGQATYIWQKKPSFDAAYSGPNSLGIQAEKGYSFSGTLFFGARLWHGAEFYFDPEVVQAVPMSNLTGLGGMVNSEQQKSSGPNPTFYRARLFLRQTWGLGGEREAVESAQNQLAGMVDKRRLVLTVGNVSILDIFDNNAYAHDGRTQFMNWALSTYGAYDYAGDTRGYTWGAAAEYYYDDWVLRAGRFMVPLESNGQRLDTRITKFHADQIELEHDHTISGQPGKIRVLAFRNKEFMGSFSDALAYAAAQGGTPDVAQVRKASVKQGYGINLEQSLSSDLGFFTRASWNDGKTETFSFTEIERSVSTGLALKGSSWHRDNDTVGVSFIQNGLSKAHQDYLAAGGLGVFIGDGRLNYQPERILEAYYNFSLRKGISLTADLQRICNPAYNADRGPVLIGSLRLHAEF